jgi:hypothetical protein
MTLADILDDVESKEKTLTILNRDEPEPIVRMLKRMVDAPDVAIREARPSDAAPGNLVILEDDRTGEERLAISAIADVGDSVLMVNSDLYITGTRAIDEVDTPDVLAGLDETTFTVSGKQKMLLIEISRHVEALAYRSVESTIHSGFQRLSRIHDEHGTRDVYERLADVNTDVHVYGTPADLPGLAGDVAIHAEENEEIRRSWFVVNTDCADDLKGALLAREVGPNEWNGLWTFDSAVVDRAAAYLEDAYNE